METATMTAPEAVVPTTTPNIQQTQMDTVLKLAGVTEPTPATDPTPSAEVVPIPALPTATASSSSETVAATPTEQPATTSELPETAPAEGVVDLNTAMAEINRLSAEVSRLKEAKPAEALPTPTIPNYLTAEELESGKMGTVEGINEVIHRSTQKAVELAMRSMVPIAEQIALKSLAQKTVIDGFYDANKDLAPHKPFVSHVAKTIFDANPGKGLEELLPEVAKVARQSIRALIKQAPAAAPTNPTAPNAAQSAPTPVLTGQPKIMAELLAHGGHALT